VSGPCEILSLDGTGWLNYRVLFRYRGEAGELVVGSGVIVIKKRRGFSARLAKEYDLAIFYVETGFLSSVSEERGYWWRLFSRKSNCSAFRLGYRAAANFSNCRFLRCRVRG
jgi:hypothetical protein